MNDYINVYGTNGVVVSNYDDNVFRVSLTDDVYENMCENVRASEFYGTIGDIDNQLDMCKSEIEGLKLENKELRKLIARLNTRVNNIVAEKQMNDFYEKNYTAKYVD